MFGANRPEVFEPDAADPGIIEARFDRDNKTRFEHTAHRSHRGELVDLKADAVAEVVDEPPGIALIPPAFEMVHDCVVGIRT